MLTDFTKFLAAIATLNGCHVQGFSMFSISMLSFTMHHRCLIFLAPYRDGDAGARELAHRGPSSTVSAAMMIFHIGSDVACDFLNFVLFLDLMVISNAVAGGFAHLQ